MQRLLWRYHWLSWIAHIGTCASCKTTKTIDRGATETGEEFSFTIGSSEGRSPDNVISRGNPFSKTVWLWRSSYGADKWYSDLVAESFEILNFFGISWCLDILLPCDIGWSFGCDNRLTATFTVEFDRLISSIVRPPCRRGRVLIRSYFESTKRGMSAKKLCRSSSEAQSLLK